MFLNFEDHPFSDRQQTLELDPPETQNGTLTLAPHHCAFVQLWVKSQLRAKTPVSLTVRVDSRSYYVTLSRYLSLPGPQCPSPSLLGEELETQLIDCPGSGSDYPGFSKSNVEFVLLRT